MNGLLILAGFAIAIPLAIRVGVEVMEHLHRSDMPLDAQDTSSSES